ncbi:MAG TPA: molybdopterin-dependent oxidoreductase [Candidatus Bathyarchaeia archaeon]|nr:molybdopterin-dependent oxidoreductase [Candidatus Bathyarchaeia archaeon]
MMEKAKSHKQTAIIVILLGVIAAVILIGFYLQNQPPRLYPGEVREYRGENLSAIDNLDENAIRGNQNVDQSKYRLTVNGLVNDSMEYTYEQVVNGFQSYEKVVTLYCVEGWNAKILWQGVLVRDVLNQSGVIATAKVVIFHAADGYTTAMPLKYFYDHDIIMAYKVNGLVLPPEKGFPFELVAESKYGYKWIKWITQIELSDDENYLGYWESRGYSNDAEVR